MTENRATSRKSSLVEYRRQILLRAVVKRLSCDDSVKSISRAQAMDFCPAKSKTLFSPRQKSADICQRHPQTADNRPDSHLFT
jgi:hypothetical protein